jgi:hypothetical protein
MGPRNVIGYGRLFEWGNAALYETTSNGFTLPVVPSYRQSRNAQSLSALPLSSPADRPYITCIMPAYNEGDRIAAVLSVVANLRTLRQIAKTVGTIGQIYALLHANRDTARVGARSAAH